MTADELARALLRKARARLDVLDLLRAKGEHSDVVREAQEVVELALKAMLRAVGIDPPRVHDVGPQLRRYASRFPDDVRPFLGRLAAISKKLRKERELAFYGDDDFIPTEEYGEGDAREAIEGARLAVDTAGRTVGR